MGYRRNSVASWTSIVPCNLTWFSFFLPTHQQKPSSRERLVTSCGPSARAFSLDVDARVLCQLAQHAHCRFHVLQIHARQIASEKSTIKCLIISFATHRHWTMCRCYWRSYLFILWWRTKNDAPRFDSSLAGQVLYEELRPAIPALVALIRNESDNKTRANAAGAVWQSRAQFSPSVPRSHHHRLYCGAAGGYHEFSRSHRPGLAHPSGSFLTWEYLRP